MKEQSTTHSCVSRVIMLRMGLRFMPPIQLLLHMKFNKTVDPSEPSCRQREDTEK